MTEAPARNEASEGSPSATDARNGPLVTVVIPAYNAAATIETTLASVRAQTYRNLEINVVDDGSQDQTAARVRRVAERDPRVRLIQQPNSGQAAARNAGIDHAHGEFIAPLDADDLWHPTKIEKQLTAMQRSGPHVGSVYCWARAIDGCGQILFDLKTFDVRGDVFAPLIFWNFIASGTLLFRRSVAVKLGGYSLPSQGTPTGVEDFKFNLDLAECCDFELVPEFLLGYTIRQGSVSTNTDAMHRGHSVVLDGARARHPELPEYLFRWASACSDRECSRVYLQRGRFLRGLKLTITAALKDPRGALSADARRIVMGGVLGSLGLLEKLRNLRRAFAKPGCGQRGETRFAAADPTKTYGGSIGWAAGHRYHIDGLRTARAQALT